ncbi:MAG: hypothetical protein RQ756_09770, partial [Flavobacteriaceae bacterium]|nr:hypothetical protein [Flavobacteriaceae bacterium]
MTTIYKIQLYLLLSSLSLAGLFAQSPDWQWAKRGGGIQPLQGGATGAGLTSEFGERVLDLVIDSNDNYYFLAEFSPSVSDY